MKIFANLIRFIYRSEPPQPTAVSFDDGLAQIVRLIAREDPPRRSPTLLPALDSSSLKTKADAKR